MAERVKRLREGYTTGACAAAAAKAATLLLFTGCVPETVRVLTPAGRELCLPVADAAVNAGRARCGVVKDAGDDPDVTDGLTICAEARPIPAGVVLRGGPGVGVVTQPGLPVPVGEPAINPVPRAMILREVGSVLPPGRGVEITISVPGGNEVAARTFNPRLGIVGGISILGTTGVVRPMSEEACRESLGLLVDVAAARGLVRLVLVPGRSGEEFAVKRYGFPPGAVVQMSNFVGFMLKRCAARNVKEVLLLGHHGKLSKVAAGVFHTHSRVADGRLEVLAAVAAAEGAAAETVNELLSCTTVEAAVGVLERAGLAQVWDCLAARASARAQAFVENRLRVGTVLLDRSGAILGVDRVATEIAAALGAKLSLPHRSGLAPGVYVVGLGPGAPEYVTPAAWRVIRGASVFVGGAGALERFAPPAAERFPVTADVQAAVRFLWERARAAAVAVLVSGDPGLFSFLGTIKRLAPELPVQVVPGVSAAAVAFARLGITWEDAVFVSLHGRQETERVVDACLGHAKVLVFTGKNFSPAALGRLLLRHGLGARRVYAFDNLSLPGEQRFGGTVAGLAALHDEKFANAVVIILG
ncbi:MAG: cobalt-precorrin-5B (C(1))-methyltransferase CbiD [Desulfotomaculales bacterium]